VVASFILIIRKATWSGLHGTSYQEASSSFPEQMTQQPIGPSGTTTDSGSLTHYSSD